MTITNTSLKLIIWIGSIVGFGIDTYVYHKTGFTKMLDIRMIWTVIPFCSLLINIEGE